MDRNKIKDYGLAYGIWGAAYGYANLSKILIEPLYSNSEVLELINNFTNDLIRRNNLGPSIAQNGDSPGLSLVEDSPKFEWDISQNTPNEGETNKAPTPPISLFEKLIRENKQFINNEEWIKEIIDSYKKVMADNEKESLFSQPSILINEFKKSLKQKEPNLQNFGKAKIRDATKIFEKVLMENG